MQKLYGIFEGNTFLYNEGVFINEQDAIDQLNNGLKGHYAEAVKTIEECMGYLEPHFLTEFSPYDVREVKKSEVVESILNYTQKNIETMQKTVFYDFQYDYIGVAAEKYLSTLRDFLSYFNAMEEEP